MRSFKFKVLMSMTSIITLSIFITIVIIGITSMNDYTDNIEENAINLVDAMTLNVESVYENIEERRHNLLERRKTELENNTLIIMSIINDAYLNFKTNDLDEDEVKQEVIESIEKVRYDNDIGYFWINDIGRPFPKMVMHPTLPELNGQVLDDERFFVTKDTGENLFQVFVDVVLENGQGYVEYLWPKPTEVGLTEEQPKISFVKLFEEWEWVVGTGLYIDDIESETEVYLETVIDDLNEMLSMQKIGDNGYYFIFDEHLDILVHPNLAGTYGGDLINPETKQSILQELMLVAEKEENYMEYLWNIPSDEQQFVYKKKTYMTYYEPLGWYLASSYYHRDLDVRVTKLTRRLISYSVALVMLSIVVSVLLVKSILRPLNALILTIKKSEKGVSLLPITVKGKTTEIQLLEETINEMIQSVNDSRRALDNTNAKLQSIMDSATLVSIVSTRPDGIIEVFNTGAERMLGYSAEELINKETPGIFHLEDEIIDRSIELTKYYGEKVEGFNVFVKKAIIEGSEEREWTYVKKNKEHITVNLHVTSIHGSEDKIVGFLGIATDVTEKQIAEKELKLKSIELFEAIADLKEQEENLEMMVKNRTLELENSLQALKEAQDKLIESEKLAALGSVVAGVAHEINTPVGSSITLSSNLNDQVTKLKEKLNEEHLTKTDLNRFIDLVDESSKLIFDNMEHTANLVNSFKLVAADQSSGIKRVINIYDYLNEILKSFGQQLERASIEVTIASEGDLNINCHPGALYQIFTNLIMNSIKHGFENMSKGKISFIIKATLEEVIITYRDDGIGIKDEHKNKIFDPFFTTKRGNGGTGLGLNIVYNLIHQKLNGSIDVRSESDKFTEFEIRFPRNNGS